MYWPKPIFIDSWYNHTEIIQPLKYQKPTLINIWCIPEDLFIYS